MQCKRNFLKLSIILFFPVFSSCYSTQVSGNNQVDYSDTYENSLISIDYSDTNNANIIYSIAITIFNKDISLLKQNIMNTIIQNSGKTLLEQTTNIDRNSHNINVNIPKNKTMTFMESIKKFGVVVDERKNGHDSSLYDVHMGNRLEKAKSILEKYNELLEDANTITDKITLEKEIISVEKEIEDTENGMKEMALRREYNMVNITITNK